MKGTEFERYAVQKCGISSNAINGYANLTAAYINPTIIEERALNVASMDVFSRLMMDRILVLGTEINNDVANIITAQLLYLTSQNPTADITLYLNTPGGSVSAGLSIRHLQPLIYILRTKLLQLQGSNQKICCINPISLVKQPLLLGKIQ